MTVHHRLNLPYLIVIFGLLVVAFVVIEALIVKYNGTTVPTPAIPRNVQTFGSGPPLRYLVMGDSTSIGQGSDYNHSYALLSAQKLGQNRSVQFMNVGISGARAKTVLSQQLVTGERFKPNLVLIAVGANDATHLTSGAVIRNSLQRIITGLEGVNCGVKIVLTGSPAMGSVPRFPWPLRQFMGLRTSQVNNTVSTVVSKNQLTMALIAAKTGQTFAAHPEFFAQDKFHPNSQGYALWTPVVNAALASALQAQPSHCSK